MEEVSGDRPRGRPRKRIHVTEDEDDLEAHIERTVKCLILDIIQAVLSSQSRPAALTVSNNSDVSATSWSGTGLAQTQLGNQSIAPNSLSRESDRSNRLSVTGMQDFFRQTDQLYLQSAPPVGVASTAPFLTRNSFASLPGDRLADNVDGQDRGGSPYLFYR